MDDNMDQEEKYYQDLDDNNSKLFDEFLNSMQDIIDDHFKEEYYIKKQLKIEEEAYYNYFDERYDDYVEIIDSEETLKLQKENENFEFPIDDCNAGYGGYFEDLNPDFHFEKMESYNYYVDDFEFDEKIFEDFIEDYGFEDDLVDDLYFYETFVEENIVPIDDSEYKLINNIQCLIEDFIIKEINFEKRLREEAEAFNIHEKEFEKYIEKLLD